MFPKSQERGSLSRQVKNSVILGEIMAAAKRRSKERECSIGDTFVGVPASSMTVLFSVEPVVPALAF